jgi:redox-sensitive bicupin YhaK (pirin superfamily)
VIDVIHAGPGVHWVGDGFRVMGYFSAYRNLVARLNPFVLLDYHPPYEYPPTTNTRRGVEPHPHRGFETVTIAFEGSVAHHDSAGNGGVIGPGDVQWMTAARGVLHREYHEEAYARRGGTMHMAQLWVNLPAAHKMDPPRYQTIPAERMGTAPLPAGEVRVVAGQHAGVTGPAHTVTKVHLFELRLRAGGQVDLTIPARENTAVLVMTGEIAIGEAARRAHIHDLVVFKNEGEGIAITAVTDAHLLVLGGEPIDEPIVQYGPFVMNHEREIKEAVADFASGMFGKLGA